MVCQKAQHSRQGSDVQLSILETGLARPCVTEHIPRFSEEPGVDYFVSGEWSDQVEGPGDSVGCVTSRRQRQEAGPALYVCLWGVRGDHSRDGRHLWWHCLVGTGKWGEPSPYPRDLQSAGGCDTQGPEGGQMQPHSCCSKTGSVQGILGRVRMSHGQRSNFGIEF